MTVKEKLRELENKYRRALRFARSCSTLQHEEAEAVLATIRWERRILQRALRKERRT